MILIFFGIKFSVHITQYYKDSLCRSYSTILGAMENQKFHQYCRTMRDRELGVLPLIRGLYSEEHNRGPLDSVVM